MIDIGKLTKGVIIWLCLSAIICFIEYLIGAFAANSFNLSDWNVEWRGFMGFLMFISVITTGAVIAELSDKN